MVNARKQFDFYYEFADGTREWTRAPTPGDARSALKKRRGGPLPKVTFKTRMRASSVRDLITQPIARLVDWGALNPLREQHVVPPPQPKSFRELTHSLIKRIGQALGLPARLVADG
jgi:hypothetical protein